MTTVQKTQNYTTEQTAEIVARYQAGEAVEFIADALGRSTRSIVAKLSREKVYVAKSKTKADVRVKKADLIVAIAEAVGTEVEKLDSLEKATAEALTLIATALAKAK